MLEDWLLNLKLGWMALIIFGGIYVTPGGAAHACRAAASRQT